MDSKVKLILLCVCLSILLALTDAILCYQCTDATGDEEKADCTHGHRRLTNHRNLYETNTLGLHDLSLLKNCTPYLHPQNGDNLYNYCMIQQVLSYGTTQAYIRDCSDGISFSFLNITRFQKLKPDNQTTCALSVLQKATVCIRLCDTDFCNGPDSGSGVFASIVTTIVMISMSRFLTHL